MLKQQPTRRHFGRRSIGCSHWSASNVTNSVLISQLILFGVLCSAAFVNAETVSITKRETATDIAPQTNGPNDPDIVTDSPPMKYPFIVSAPAQAINAGEKVKISTKLTAINEGVPTSLRMILKPIEEEPKKSASPVNENFSADVVDGQEGDDEPDDNVNISFNKDIESIEKDFDLRRTAEFQPDNSKDEPIEHNDSDFENDNHHNDNDQHVFHNSHKNLNWNMDKINNLFTEGLMEPTTIPVGIVNATERSLSEGLDHKSNAQHQLQPTTDPANVTENVHTTSSAKPISPMTLPDLIMLTTTLNTNTVDQIEVATPVPNIIVQQQLADTTEKPAFQPLESKVSHNSSGSEKRPKYINDNSTNLQQLNLPDRAEVWTLASMKTVPQGDPNFQQSTTENMNVHDSSSSGQNEKNLLDWTQIMRTAGHEQILASATIRSNDQLDNQVIDVKGVPAFGESSDNRTEILLNSTLDATEAITESSTTTPVESESNDDIDDMLQVQTTSNPYNNEEEVKGITTANWLVSQITSTSESMPSQQSESSMRQEERPTTPQSPTTVLPFSTFRNEINDTVLLSPTDNSTSQEYEPIGENTDINILPIAATTNIAFTEATELETKTEIDNEPIAVEHSTELAFEVHHSLSTTLSTPASVTPIKERLNDATVTEYDNNNSPHNKDDAPTIENKESELNMNTVRVSSNASLFSTTESIAVNGIADANFKPITQGNIEEHTENVLLDTTTTTTDFSLRNLNTTSTSNTTTTGSTTTTKSATPTELILATDLNENTTTTPLTTTTEVNQIGNEVDLESNSEQVNILKTIAITTLRTPATHSRSNNNNNESAIISPTSSISELLLPITTKATLTTLSTPSTPTTPPTTTTTTTTTIPTTARTSETTGSFAKTVVSVVELLNGTRTITTELPPPVNAVENKERQPVEIKNNTLHDLESSIETNVIDPLDKSPSQQKTPSTTTADTTQTVPTFLSTITTPSTAVTLTTVPDTQDKVDVAIRGNETNAQDKSENEQYETTSIKIMDTTSATMSAITVNNTTSSHEANTTKTTESYSTEPPLINLLDDSTTTVEVTYSPSSSRPIPSTIVTKDEELYSVVSTTISQSIPSVPPTVLPSTFKPTVTTTTTTTTSSTTTTTTSPPTTTPEETLTTTLTENPHLFAAPSMPVPTTVHPPMSPPTHNEILHASSGVGDTLMHANAAGSPGTDVNAIIAISVSVVGVIALVLVVAFLYLMRKRQKQMSYGQRCRPVSLDAYSLDNVSVLGSVRRKGAMRSSKRSYGNAAFDDPSLRHNILNASELAKFIERRSSIFDEFRDVPQIIARADEVPSGCEDKNRYANVIPLPETRVVLQQQNSDEKTEYINANYVTSPKDTPNYYIACQAPLETTVIDFWRMIWEQQSRVIIQATDLIENGIEKCAEYLPPSVTLDNHTTYGDFQITLKNREIKDKYAISIIILRNTIESQTRELTHYWYKWPEAGVPNEEAPIIAMLLEARSSLKSYAIEQANELKEKSSTLTLKSVSSGDGDVKSTPTADSNGEVKEVSNGEINGNVSTERLKAAARNQGPLLIHCSPGTGRTGTIIACDMAIRNLETPKRSVDIPQIVYYVRRGRASAVQTKEQYEFIYKVANMYATKITNLSNEN